VELVLLAGAKADARNKDGLTPLELARKFGHANLIPAFEGTKATN
jgi:ankyrin repeat protein